MAVYSFFIPALAFLGIWKIDTPKRCKLFFEIYHHFVVVIFFLNYSLCCADSYLARQNKDRLFTDLCANTLGTIFVVKLGILRLKKKNIEQMDQNLKNNLNLSNFGVTASDSNIIGTYSRRFALLTTVVLFGGIVTVIFTTIFPVMDKGNFNNWKLPYYIPLLEEKIQSPTFEILIVEELYSIMTCGFSFLLFDLLLYGLLDRICVHFCILEANVRGVNKWYRDEPRAPQKSDVVQLVSVEMECQQLKKNKEKNLRLGQQIKCCIAHHQNIIKQAEEINDIFSYSIFALIIGGAGLVAVVSFDIILHSRELNVRVFSRLVYAGCFLTDVLIVCYYGTELEYMCRKVGDALYDLPWYEMDIPLRRICLFAIAQTQRPSRVKGGHFFFVSLETYLKLLHWSYNLIALMENFG